MKKLIRKILNKFGYGFCFCCKRLTKQKYPFADDYDCDPEGNCYPTTYYPDYCDYECFEHLVSKI